MTKFQFGKDEVEVGPLCLAAVLLAGELMPAAQASGDRRATFNAFVKVLACQLEPEDPSLPPVWTERRILRSIAGQGQIDALSVSMTELFTESGFVPQAPPTGADSPPSSDTNEPSTSAEPLSLSSSVSPATA